MARFADDGVTAAGAKWDITALSYYCMWHGSLANLSTVITDVRGRYGKPVVIAETAYQFTSADADNEPNSIPGTVLCDNIPATWAGQAQQFTWTQNTARNAGAVGVFYWEPTWTAVRGAGWDPADASSGNAYENQALFDFEGKALPGLKELGAP